ncbi:MAG: hypothetical protein IPP33_12760 [Flavobacteriales bacterium]|nr:hypothetical protein [Flavobacteriales bacterium]
MATAKMGLQGLPATGIVAKSQGIQEKMDGNALYPAADPTPAAMQTDIDALAAANAEVSNNGGKAAYQARNVAEKKVRANLKKWVGYVQMVSGGDKDKILLSGFGIAERGTPYGQPQPPLNLNARLTRTANRVSLFWEYQPGVDVHHVFVSKSNDPFAWELIGSTTKCRFDVNSLPSGEARWFAVTAIGAAGESTKSDVLLARAA